MIKIIHTNSSCEDFKYLISLLDTELNARYGAEQLFYNQFNEIESLETVVIAYFENLPAGCGCFKSYNDTTAEIKRMFVHPEFRGKGISKLILSELEVWSKKLGFENAILETGINQLEAINLYKKNGYVEIENFGQYFGKKLSVCFQKYLNGN